MKNNIALIIIISSCICIYAQKKVVLSEKFTTVLNHYKKTKETEKYNAATFLLSNMKGHSSPNGPAIDMYLNELDKINNYQIDSIDYCWNIANEKYPENVKLKEDSITINSNDIIENIDDAFSGWRNVPWKKEIPFECFCKYILPYRCLDEVYKPHWRKILTQKYAPLIASCTDMKEAYVIINNRVKSSIKANDTECPYNIDPVSIDRIKNGNCVQYSVLTVSILRALGIPAAIDMTPLWANYSISGHLWPSLILNDSTYTLKNKDSIARKNNPIDGSEFYKFTLAKDDHYPNDILIKKKAPKVFRYTFEKNKSHSFLQDVSDKYGMNSSITINTTDKDKTKYFLCVFLTGYDWVSIDSTESVNKKIRFSNVGNNIVYLIKKKEKGRLNSISNPFIFHDGMKVDYLTPSTEKESVVLYRKYPIISPIVIQWEKMKGSTIEASNDNKFMQYDTIGILHQLPYDDYKIEITTKMKYRYIRYNTQTTGTEIAEFGIYGENNKEIKGKAIYDNVDPGSIQYAFDRNPLTKIKTLHHNYYFGEDLGNKYRISAIKLMPKNDGNDIQAGDMYELFYFDNKWISLGKQKVEVNHIAYKVPKNSILLLRDLNSGSEERIFICKDGKQLFY